MTSPSSLHNPEIDWQQLELKAYGEKFIAPISLDKLILLTQTRSSINPEAGRLKESIKQNGLINQPDVAQLSQLGFSNYINFINEVWRVGHNPDDYLPANDGKYYLVVAGHTRLEAIKLIEDESRLELGSLHTEPVVHCKIHQNMTSQDIIALQLDENIHRQPARERSAMAIVETYMYGIKNGQWANKAEFLRHSKHKFGKDVLDDALNFAELPVEIRDFILLGGVSYRAGVELGKTLPVYQEYVATKYFSALNSDELSTNINYEFDDGITEWLGAEIAHLQNTKLRATIIRQRYRSLRQQYADFVNSEAEGKELRLDVLVDPLADWRETRRRTRRHYRESLQKLADEPFAQAGHIMSMHLELWAPNQKTNQT